MTDRIHNFSAGPAVLPEPVLRKAQEAIWNVAGSGIGIVEHSHRGKVFDRILDEAERACRDLAGIPDNYRVLFLQGGASLQFSMVPIITSSYQPLTWSMGTCVPRSFSW